MILLQSALFLFCLSFQDLELTHLLWSVSWLIEMQLSVLSSNMSTELCTLRIFLNAWLRSLLANWRYHVSYFYHFFLSENQTSHVSVPFAFQTAVLLWMHDLPGRDAIIVRQALIADILNLETATEVICSRTSSQIQVFKQHYYAKFGVHLEHDIELRASGDHKKVKL